eukprot:10680110-Alexandrium_andersonii.AAC.1
MDEGRCGRCQPRPEATQRKFTCTIVVATFASSSLPARRASCVLGPPTPRVGGLPPSGTPRMAPPTRRWRHAGGVWGGSRYPRRRGRGVFGSWGAAGPQGLDANCSQQVAVAPYRSWVL